MTRTALILLFEDVKLVAAAAIRDGRMPRSYQHMYVKP